MMTMRAGFGILLCLLLTALAHAQTEPPPSLSAVFLKKLTEAQTALEQKHRENSYSILQALTDQVGNTPYENGLAWSMLGYLHYQNADLKQSAQAYEKALQFDIPLSLAQDNRKILGQVYLSDGNCTRAVAVFEQWLTHAQSGTEDVRVWTAQCHYQLGRFQNAVQQLNAAIASAQTRQQRPKEAWLSLLQASLAQLDEARDRIDTLKMLLRWYPKTDYWLALASAFGQLDQMDNYLATLAVAERRELLSSETQYLSLANVYYSEKVPYRAAQILEEGLRKNLIRPSEKNLRFLASCYTVAQEFDKAIAPLQKAAAQAKDGESDALLGNALFQLARWKEAAEALETALNKGGGKQRDTLWLMLGQTYLNLHQFDRAIYAFQQVLPVESRSRQAQQWINYAEHERKRYTELGLIKESDS